MKHILLVVVVLLVLLFVVAIVITICARYRRDNIITMDAVTTNVATNIVTDDATNVIGGAPRRTIDYTKSPHIIVDTLNFTHWLNNSGPLTLTPELIAKTIDRTASVLRERHSGRIMYVLKDRESQFNDKKAHEIYKSAAERNKVYVIATERYVDPPKGVALSKEHSAQGRDDFFMSLLAYRYKCAVLTEDRLRDFDKFRATVQPFHVYEYAFWRTKPEREYIRPEAQAFARIKKPRMIRYSEYFDRGQS